jgi:hypothetical protein
VEKTLPDIQIENLNSDSKENIRFLEIYFDKKIDDLKQKHHPMSSYLTITAPSRIKWLDHFIVTVKNIQNNNNSSLLKIDCSTIILYLILIEESFIT